MTMEWIILLVVVLAVIIWHLTKGVDESEEEPIEMEGLEEEPEEEMNEEEPSEEDEEKPEEEEEKK